MPEACATTAAPRPWVATTLSPPNRLQNNNTCDDDDTCIAEKTWSNDPFLHVLNARNRRLLGCVYCNYNGPDDAVETAYFSYKAQAFLQEYSGQYSAYDDGEGAHGGYEDGVGEGVCDEITTRY